jgi:hypothetical protein
MTVSKLNQPGFVMMSSPVPGITKPLFAMLFLVGADFILGLEPFLTHFLVIDIPNKHRVLN